MLKLNKIRFTGKKNEKINALDKSTYQGVLFTNIIFLVWIIKPQGAKNYLRLNAENTFLCKRQQAERDRMDKGTYN